MSFEPSILNDIPRLGWVEDPSPITELQGLAKTFKTRWLGCKRDDLCSGLYGGTKVRKLDYLLASAPYNDAPSWATLGAIGSGHMAACCAAAKKLNRKIQAHLFWEPVTGGILENLAYTASAADTIYNYRSRIDMIIKKPALFFRESVDGSVVIPFGSTCPVGVLGIVRAGLELASQVRRGELPEPKRIYAALGSCGTVAGLAIGTALGGLNTRIHAVTAVERIISMKFHLNRLIARTRILMVDQGLAEVADIPPSSIYIDRSQLGYGYGFPTKESLKVVKLMKGEGIMIEPVYSGKAAAAMFHDLSSGVDEPVLFWNTMRRELPEVDDHWTRKLPANLFKKLTKEQGLH